MNSLKLLLVGYIKQYSGNLFQVTVRYPVLNNADITYLVCVFKSNSMPVVI